MSWATPPTFTAHTTLGAASLQTLSDDLTYLLTGVATNGKYDKGSDITTTSTTFTAIDSTNLAKTVTLAGTKCLVIFQGVQVTTAASQTYDINVNGTRWSSTGNDGRVVVSGGATQTTCTVIAVIDGLTPGSNTFQILWRTQSAATITLRTGSGTANQDFIPAFEVWGA